MGETMDKFATAGRKNVFGQVVKAVTTGAVGIGIVVAIRMGF